MARLDDLPIAVIGAGPIGLAAAAHLASRGLAAKIYEAGPSPAASVKDWSHVRLFSPWRECIDDTARRLLQHGGWREPDPGALPTGAAFHELYLNPLAALPDIAPAIEAGARVTGISRLGIDKLVSQDRERRPFVLDIATRAGRRRDLASAVIDASGTWRTPNLLGSGLAAEGEPECADRIHYGIPDVLGRDRSHYAGESVLVVGAGHSAANVLLDLARLADEEPATTITWAVRRRDASRVYGGGAADQLAGRAALGEGVRRLVDSGRVKLVASFAAIAVRARDGGLFVEAEAGSLGPFGRIVVTTGQRPDVALARELRLDLDPVLESARALAPLIDPNVHSCGTVPPHGHRALANPEPNFYTVGIKSYGRAPNFLLLTGYEQVRSVVAALAGDMAAADNVELVLPETGVCSGGASRAPRAEACCGGPAPAMADACCQADAVAKEAGASGCGCGPAKPVEREKELA
jgi:hypothetical protein